MVAWCTVVLLPFHTGVAAAGDTLPIAAIATADPPVEVTTGGSNAVNNADAGPVLAPRAVARLANDTIPRRRAVTVSDWYARRLTIHRYGSYLMLPLFAGQFVLGQQLLSQKDGVYDGTRRVPIDAGLRRTHRAAAYGVGALFAVNTTTGLWNLWDARHDESHSMRRTAHVLSMIGADVGFAVSGMMASRAVNRRPSDARAHRNVAVASMGLATVGATLMWF